MVSPWELCWKIIVFCSESRVTVAILELYFNKGLKCINSDAWALSLSFSFVIWWLVPRVWLPAAQEVLRSHSVAKFCKNQLSIWPMLSIPVTPSLHIFGLVLWTGTLSGWAGGLSNRVNLLLAWIFPSSKSWAHWEDQTKNTFLFSSLAVTTVRF